MSSDSDHTYPVNKRKKIIISDSDNSNESIILQTRRKKKIYRVVSEEESSDDDSDVPKPVIRRQKNYRVISEDESKYDSESEANKSTVIDSSSSDTSEWHESSCSSSDELNKSSKNAKRKVLPNYDSSASEANTSTQFDNNSGTTSEWQEDWSSTEELDNDVKSKHKVLSKTKKKKKADKSPSANVDSDSSNEQLEKCPICLLPFRKQQVGTPSTCEHCFCLDCLLEWSKNINTCPVDRKVFTTIHVKNRLGRKVIKHLPVEVAPRPEDQTQDDPTFCEVCHLSDREDRMLLCDGCDCGYHLECLTPPMTSVPMDEWFCPECSQNSQNDAEAIEIDVDEISDLMEEARRLGVSYGRTRTGTAESGASVPRIVPRTRHTERVRATIRNRTGRNNITNVRYFDPNQPSTSSGLDSIGDNSRSPNAHFHAYGGNASSTRSNRTSKTTKKKRKNHGKKGAPKNGTMVREVRIREINDDGEEKEIVTYVKVASSTSRRKCKKRTKKTRKRRKGKRRARTVSSVLANARTVKRRLAAALGMNKPKLEVPLLVPTMRNNISLPEKSALKIARYNAGIPRVSLFGDNLGLDYSPPMSDDDDEYSIGSGPLMVTVQRRSAVPSLRRRAVLKTIAGTVNEVEDAPNILDSIINSQELWHSAKKSNMTLRADGTLLVSSPEKENKHSVNNNESPKKEKQEVVTQRKEVILKEVDTPLDLSSINPNNITQAPMYNNPCGGGNRGNFRGGYRDNGRHGHHGGQSYGGGRDSLPPGSGRHGGYGGGGAGPRDNFGNRDFGPPPFYNPSFEHCGGPPMFSGTQPPPPFRGRNPQHFRNERLRFPPPPPPPIERPFNSYNTGDGFERPPFPHAQDQRFPRPRLPPPPPPLGMPPPPPVTAASCPNPTAEPLNTPPPPPPPTSVAAAAVHVRNSLPAVLPEMDVMRSYQSERNEHANACLAPEPISAPPADARQENNDDCDIYCDIEPPSKSDCDAPEEQQQQQQHGNGSMILLPPPEPPSGLLDFDENSRSDKDNDSEQELVIDDSHKEEHASKDLTPSGDKYDPFAADSDSNDDGNNLASSAAKAPLERTPAEMSRSGMDSCNIPMPTAPPPILAPTCPSTIAVGSVAEVGEPAVRLTAYDDDDGDNESQSDCPNFSIYSSQTMDVARHTEQELSQQLGPLQPPPLPPCIPDDDDIIVGDVQACDLPDVPEPATNPYLEALQKERQILSKIPPKKISHDSHRGKITFKIGNKLRLNNRLSGLHDDDGVNSRDHQLPSTDAAGSKPASQQQQQQQQQQVDKPKIDSSIVVLFDDEPEDKDADKSDDGPSKLAEEPAVKLTSSQSAKIVSLFGDEEDEDATANVESDSKKRTRPGDSSDEEAAKEKDDKSSDKKDEDEDDEREASSPPPPPLPPPPLPPPPLESATKEDDESVAITENTMVSYSSSSSSSSPRKQDSGEPVAEGDSENLETDDKACDASKVASSHHSSARDDSTRESSSDEYDSLSNKADGKANRDKYDVDRALSDDNNEDPHASLDQQHEKASSSFSVDDEVEEQFPIEKDKVEDIPTPTARPSIDNNWESDGAYTPCKDELPVTKDDNTTAAAVSSFEDGGLEPITPTKDKANDDLDDCRTPPASYAGLGTEDISETDEAINFEEELLNLAAMRKEKDMEDGEIPDESKLKEKRGKSRDEKEDDGKRRKKKDRKEKSKEHTEKNKENISSDNLVSWKKISKSTKERQYRDKDRRSKSREQREKEREKDKPSRKRVKEVGRKKERRKELPRYDVRKIVAEKPRPSRKDEYGRDIRENSRSSRSSDLLAGPKDRRSFSKGRTRSRSRLRLSWSRDRGSYSKCRSSSRRPSVSRNRRKLSRRRSVSRRRSLSRRHSVSRRRSRSLSRKRRSSLSPRRRSRRSLSRSRDKRKDKTKKYKSRSRSRNRKRTRSKSPKRLRSKSRDRKHGKRKPVHSRSRSKGRSCSRDRERNARNWEQQLNEKSMEQQQQQQHSAVEQREFPPRTQRDQRSWSAQWTPSWSRSRSKTPPHMQQEPLGSRNWSPPPVLDSVSPKNLTVILTNKEAIKKKKKERRKESRKSKSESEKRRKSKRNRTPPPSKEVFASGDNILVSVCFNKDNETNPSVMPELPETIPLVPPIKRRRRDSVTEAAAPPKRSKKDKTKDKRSKSPKGKKDKKKKSKAAEIAATKKPVAVIDLDQSPFREQTPSPRDVIVLSDDDDKQAQEVATPEQCPASQVTSPPREQFVSQGPKTPPEPQIKFSINKQPSNMRPSLINPLLEEEEEEMEEMEEEEMMDERAEEELEMRAQEELELRLKIGPNTPPEPPTSPLSSSDVYDPFDPTKSRSPTPDASQEATPNDERDRAQRNSPRKHDTADTPLPDEPSQQQDQPSQEKPPEKPKIISMVTIKRASPQRDTASPAPENQADIAQSCNSPPKTQPNQQNVQSTANPFATINPVLATVAAAVQRSAVFNTNTPNAAQRTLLQSNRTSPSNQIKPRTNDRPQLPNIFTNSTKTTMARSSKTTQGKNSSTIGQNGSDPVADMANENIDMSSPYSPGSTLSDGLFDPPSPINFNSSPVVTAPPAAAKTSTAQPKVNKIAEKKDPFDALFGGVLPPVKTVTKSRNKKTKEKTKKSTNPKVGVRMDENQLQILDDLPSSAVEMQVKDKFLKKLNRQERVVEEVKLVLKPHYTKKHITKEEYKDIMRKAVPKICHNKTGEINPKKIAHLVEAYVRKCRNRKKTSANKTSKPAKTLWS